jgi:hypothetical protein
MKRVDDDLGAREGLADGGREDRRHVANLFDDAARLASALLQERLERDDRFLALAGRDKDQLLLLSTQIDEHGDIAVSTLRRRFFETVRLEPTETKSPQINASSGLRDLRSRFTLRCERFHKTILDEFYRVVLRKKIYRSINELQAFLATVPLARDKMIAVE